MREEFALKLKEKDDQINKFMHILSILPEVYKEKLDDNKIPKSFHNEDQKFEKEKKILKDIFNNLDNQTKKEVKTTNTNIRNTSTFKQKKLSWWFFHFLSKIIKIN